jgi:hypothetical protein
MISHLMPRLITILGTLTGSSLSQERHIATEEIITDYAHCTEDEDEA